MDNEKLYIETVRTYVEAARIQDNAQGFLSSLESTLNSLREELFNDELLQLVERKEQFLSQEADPLEYTRYLIDAVRKHDIGLGKYKYFSQLVDLEIYQRKINPKEI